jgi:hypothetical protein
MNFKEHGFKINVVVMVKNDGQMAIYIKVIGKKTRGKAKDSLYGQTAIVIKANGKIIKRMEKELMCDLIMIFTLENGRMIKYVVMEFSNGQMEVLIKVKFYLLFLLKGEWLNNQRHGFGESMT